MKIIGKTILTLLVLSISVLCGMEIQKRANLVSQILPDTIILGNGIKFSQKKKRSDIIFIVTPLISR